VTQGRKAGGYNSPRAYDYAIMSTQNEQVVTFSCKSPDEAEQKGKKYCGLFGYDYGHAVKGPRS
tara:strand:+ start:880 stop:1071 length:192 start_codon:yes stop_codon:yes gene_type:complete